MLKFKKKRKKNTLLDKKGKIYLGIIKNGFLLHI